MGAECAKLSAPRAALTAEVLAENLNERNPTMAKVSEIVGRRFGMMVALERTHLSRGRFIKLRMRCDCGNEVEFWATSVREGRRQNCGCVVSAAAAARDISGQRFGRLVAIERAIPGRDKLWLLQCDCGAIKKVDSADLRHGKVTSCGCLNIKHHMSQSTEFRCWSAMLSRCRNPNVPAWRNYGGRGISVCDRWSSSFQNFLEDMGQRPPGLDLDRVDNNGNYEPGNCRWVTRKENMRNRRVNTRVNFRGALRTVAEVSEIAGVNRQILYQRLGRNWDIERAVSTPAAVKLRRRK